MLTWEEFIEQNKRLAAKNDEENEEHVEEEDEDENKKQQNSRLATHISDSQNVAETTLKEIETPEIRLQNEWKHYFSGISDVDKDLKDIPDNASNAFCITLFFTHEDIDNLSYSFIEKAFEQFPEKE